ncbi:hypothetical protein PRIPAC_85330 [Pristionchus pacificus]|uniref:WW domain-containing protein n=1 Tax=Pristionchus pacificus TaxID=54126 RepID=A0A2A6BGT1_PRIPA|nr:hypothetical protein PRIPAC_85330 [Pristionchus pacificus]|eukprot:PDM65068.1 hypothetical protein PRIPAC_53317 [Pristionchus pacificus]
MTGLTTTRSIDIKASASSSLPAEWIEFSHLPDSFPSSASSSPPSSPRSPLYLNLRTGIAQWTLPGGCKIIRHDEPQWWLLHSQEKERDYFYNPQSGETLWSAPSDAAHILNVAAAMKLARDIDRPDASSQGDAIDRSSAVRFPQRRNARVFAR